MKSYHNQRKIALIFRYVLLAILAVLWIFPIIWIILASFSYNNTGFVSTIWPDKFTWQNRRDRRAYRRSQKAGPRVYLPLLRHQRSRLVRLGAGLRGYAAGKDQAPAARAAGGRDCRQLHPAGV